jgi:hypothetical protein
MILNVLLFHFIEKIINKMKERKETIELEEFGHITDIRNQTFSDLFLSSIMSTFINNY